MPSVFSTFCNYWPYSYAVITYYRRVCVPFNNNIIFFCSGTHFFYFVVFSEAANSTLQWAHYHVVCKCDTHLHKKAYNTTVRVHKSFYEFERILFLFQTYGITDSVLVRPLSCFFFLVRKRNDDELNANIHS